MRQISIDRYKFEAWLRVQDPGRVFQKSNCACPLACYLQHRYRASLVEVGYAAGRLLAPGVCRIFESPAWATEFMRRFDGPRRASRKLTGTAKQALKALEKVS